MFLELDHETLMELVSIEGEGGRGGGSVENNTNTSRRSGRASFPMTITIIPRLALLQSIT